MFAEGSEGLVQDLMDRRRAGRVGICEPRRFAILGLEMIHRVHLRTAKPRCRRAQEVALSCGDRSPSSRR